MNTLICVTGEEKEIMKKWLPSLRGKGVYDGDVLILDYFKTHAVASKGSFLRLPFSDETVKRLPKNVIYRKTSKVYDVIMTTDGNDIQFYKPIQPLLDVAKNGLCAVKEPRLNKAYEIWKPTSKLPSEHWENIKNERTINAGVIAGPASAMKALLEFMVKNMKRCVDFGSEQLSLNVWHYFYGHPLRDVGYAWNCLPLMGTKLTMRAKISLIDAQSFQIERLGFVLTPFVGDNVEIAVLHLHQDLLEHHFPTRFNRGDPRFRHLLVGDMLSFSMPILIKSYADYDIPLETQKSLEVTPQ